MKKNLLLALSAVILIGISAGIYKYAKKNVTLRSATSTTRVSATPHATFTSTPDDDLPVTDESRAETIEELHYQDAVKISSYVSGKECCTSDKKILNKIKGIISRLSPNKMTEPPMPKDGSPMLEGAWTCLGIHDKNGMMYSFLLTNLGGGSVVYVSGGKYSFYCDIQEADIKLFQKIYEKIYDQYSQS